MYIIWYIYTFIYMHGIICNIACIHNLSYIQFKIPAAAVASEINFNLKETFQQICHNEGTKTGPSRGDHFW